MTPDQWAAVVLLTTALVWIVAATIRHVLSPAPSSLGEDDGGAGTNQSPP